MVVRSTGFALHHTSKAVHRLLALGTALLVLVSCLLAAAAWRLSQGPIDLQSWSDPVRAALVDDTGPIHVSFDRVLLAWEGFHKGVDHPLDLRLTQVSLTDQAGQLLVAAPAAHVTFSLAGLLLGRIVPRELEVDHARTAVTRQTDGAFSLGWDISSENTSEGAVTPGDSTGRGSLDLDQLREQLARPASSDHGRSRGLFDQIERAHFRNSDMTFRDSKSGLIVRTADLDLDLVRVRTGHVHGEIRAPLRVGDQPAGLTAQADWAAGAESWIDVAVTPLRMSAAGSLPNQLDSLKALDLPLSVSATVGFDPGFRPGWVQAEIQLGEGHIRVGQGAVPIRSGTVAVSGTLDSINLTKAHFDLAHAPDGVAEIVDISGKITRAAERLSASLMIDLGKTDIADLPLLWPKGVGGGAQPWVTEHVTAGTVTHGQVSLVVEADDALHDVVLTQAAGELDGTNGTFTWIDNVPPVEQTEFQLHLVDPDTLDIHVASGHQRIRTSSADLLIGDSRMRITGLSMKDQIAVIRTQVSGPVASALALLKEPRLNLLSSHPIGLKPGAGDVSAILDFTLPLQNNLQIDDVQIHADAHVAKLKLLDVVGGQDLDGGVFDLAIDKNGLSLKGRGSVAAIPVTGDGTMDFSNGAPDQVVQKITVSAQPDSLKLDQAGFHVTDFLDGPVPSTAVVTERRNGDGSIAINSDLTRSALMVDPLAWRKSPGTAATGAATVVLSHDRPVRIDNLAVQGDGLLLSGSADFSDGHFRTLRLDTIRFGGTQGQGTIHHDASGPFAIALQGDQIDLAPKLAEKMSGDESTDAPQTTTPAWALDARFDHAILANGEHADAITATAAGGGSLIRLIDVTGGMRMGPGLPASAFSVRIEPRGGTRHFQVEAKDAGSFLRGVDAIRGMRSGHLLVDGVLTRSFGLYPLTGTATIDDVIVRNSPFLGKLLQAITLYGLVDVLSGPGMAFSRVVVPFRYGGANLSIYEAHAANSSLGLTLNGRIGLSTGQSKLTGTIVPAYFFNSMLGHLPLVGKLFSPEKGGGVFAARFGVDGPIDDPTISINPISALTPGFLREIFGIFDRTPAEKAPKPEETK